MNIDEIVIDKVQCAYLYLWDRFGVTVGAVCNVVVIVNAAGFALTAESRGTIAFMAAFDAFQILINGWYRHLQLTSLSGWNVVASRHRYGWPMVATRWALMAFVVISNIPYSAKDFIHMAFGLEYNLIFFLWCVLLRERDDSRFKKRKLVTAAA